MGRAHVRHTCVHRCKSKLNLVARTQHVVKILLRMVKNKVARCLRCTCPRVHNLRAQAGRVNAPRLGTPQTTERPGRVTTHPGTSSDGTMASLTASLSFRRRFPPSSSVLLRDATFKWQLFQVQIRGAVRRMAACWQNCSPLQP